MASKRARKPRAVRPYQAKREDRVYEVENWNAGDRDVKVACHTQRIVVNAKQQKCTGNSMDSGHFSPHAPGWRPAPVPMPSTWRWPWASPRPKPPRCSPGSQNKTISGASNHERGDLVGHLLVVRVHPCGHLHLGILPSLE